jgi:hypothetical protein
MNKYYLHTFFPDTTYNYIYSTEDGKIYNFKNNCFEIYFAKYVSFFIAPRRHAIRVFKELNKNALLSEKKT